MPSQNKVITTSKPKVNITLHPCFWNADRKKHSPKCGVTKMDISRLKKRKVLCKPWQYKNTLYLPHGNPRSVTNICMCRNVTLVSIKYRKEELNITWKTLVWKNNHHINIVWFVRTIHQTADKTWVLQGSTGYPYDTRYPLPEHNPWFGHGTLQGSTGYPHDTRYPLPEHHPRFSHSTLHAVQNHELTTLRNKSNSLNYLYLLQWLVVKNTSLVFKQDAAAAGATMDAMRRERRRGRTRVRQGGTHKATPLFFSHSITYSFVQQDASKARPKCYTTFSWHATICLTIITPIRL